MAPKIFEWKVIKGLTMSEKDTQERRRREWVRESKRESYTIRRKSVMRDRDR
jgi:hypothetical protein